MLVCSSCREEWSLVGKDYKRSDEDRYEYKCACGCRRKPIQEDEEILAENVRLAKQKQKQQDTNRIERKAFREHARVENAIEEYSSAILDILKEHGVKLSSSSSGNTLSSVIDNEREVGIIHVTDTHFNELIDLPNNKYDMGIASRRLHKLAKEACATFSARGIQKVLIAFTGDLMNSDRRLDELLNQATNRAMATFVAVDLLRQFVLDIASKFAVSVASVLGNESRVGKDLAFSDNVLSDNYDFTIVNMVRLLVEGSGIVFSPLDRLELIVNVNGQKMLMSHGLNKIASSQVNIQSNIGRYYINGNEVDFSINGHIHSTHIGDFNYRSASLAGANAFSEGALGFASKASQNIIIVGKNHRYAMAIDLQHTNDESYNIDEALMMYNCKSQSKVNQKTVVFEVVI